MAKIRPIISSLLHVGVATGIWLGCVACKPAARQDAAQPPAQPAANAPVVETVAAAAEAVSATPIPTRDHSLSNSVSVVFGEQDEENGLEHRSREKDGLTKKVRVGDTPCRLLNLKDTRSEAYIYFAIDSGFKADGLRNVKIEIEYFDIVFDRPSSFNLQFDGTGVRQGPNPAYASVGPMVYLRGTEQWQTATFHVRNAGFQNKQNGQADFRVNVRPPELYVRKVTVTRESPVPARP